MCIIGTFHHVAISLHPNTDEEKGKPQGDTNSTSGKGDEDAKSKCQPPYAFPAYSSCRHPVASDYLLTHQRAKGTKPKAKNQVTTSAEHNVYHRHFYHVAISLYPNTDEEKGKPQGDTNSTSGKGGDDAKSKCQPSYASPAYLSCRYPVV